MWCGRYPPSYYLCGVGIRTPIDTGSRRRCRRRHPIPVATRRGNGCDPPTEETLSRPTILSNSFTVSGRTKRGSIVLSFSSWSVVLLLLQVGVSSGCRGGYCSAPWNSSSFSCGYCDGQFGVSWGARAPYIRLCTGISISCGRAHNFERSSPRPPKSRIISAGAIRCSAKQTKS